MEKANQGGSLDKNNWFELTLFRTMGFSCKRRADNKWDGRRERERKTHKGDRAPLQALDERKKTASAELTPFR